MIASGQVAAQSECSGRLMWQSRLSGWRCDVADPRPCLLLPKGVVEVGGGSESEVLFVSNQGVHALEPLDGRERDGRDSEGMHCPEAECGSLNGTGNTASMQADHSRAPCKTGSNVVRSGICMC